MNYWNSLATEFGADIANIATGSPTPARELMAMEKRGTISKQTRDKAAAAMGYISDLEGAAAAEDAFEKRYDI